MMHSWWFEYASWDLVKSSGIRKAQRYWVKSPGLALTLLPV